MNGDMRVANKVVLAVLLMSASVAYCDLVEVSPERASAENYINPPADGSYPEDTSSYRVPAKAIDGSGLYSANGVWYHDRVRTNAWHGQAGGASWFMFPK